MKELPDIFRDIPENELRLLADYYFKKAAEFQSKAALIKRKLKKKRSNERKAAYQTE